MDYADVVAAAFGPRPEGTPTPDVVTRAGPARRLRDAVEPVAMHAVWSATTNGRLAELGLDFLGAYIGGRAASLGTPVGAVVVSAFAWFEPGLVVGVLEAVRAAVDRDRIAAIRDEATTASLRDILGGDDPGAVATALADATEPADGTGRSLFSALRSKGRPVDPYQRLWWACDLIREHRGDSHVAAAAVAGLGPVEMNVLTELWLGMPLFSYTATRGWPEAQMRAAVAGLEARRWVEGGHLTEEGRHARDEVEAQTDAQEQSSVDALGTDLEELCARLDGWGRRCIDAGAFPADTLKRAAG